MKHTLNCCHLCAPLRHPSQVMTRRALAARPLPKQARPVGEKGGSK